jgi:hypothetical protein
VERRAQRYTVWLPIRVEELPEGMAVTHNASGCGLLVVTASALDVGWPVSVTMRVPPDGDTEKSVHGRVVRVELNDEDPDGMWPHRLAVEFDHPVPELEELLKNLAGSGMAKIQR